MINKETYEREITRMFDSVRTNSKGEHTCSGVKCKDCPFYSVGVCHSYGAANAYNVYEEAIKCIDYVERWSKEHPEKHKVSKLEYDILDACTNLFDFGDIKMLNFSMFDRLHEIGYFKGVTKDMYIRDYFNNCEVADNDGWKDL